MENQHVMPVNIRTFGIRYGLILAGLIFGLNTVLVVTDSHHGGDAGDMPFLLNIVVTIIAVLLLKKANNGSLRLLDAIKVGLWMAVVSSILVVIMNFTYTSLIEPDYHEAVYEMHKDTMPEAHARFNPEDTLEDWQRQLRGELDNYWTGYIDILLLSLIIGAIISLLTAWIINLTGLLSPE